jgi:hypothetical protein
MTITLKMFRVGLLSLAMVSGLWTDTVLAQTTDDVGALGSFLFQVQAGDSLTGLFGSDWQKVYNNNCSYQFRDWVGDAGSPNFLLVGSVLKVPDNTYLTPRAQERILAVKEQRASLHDRLMRLENGSGGAGASAAKLDQALSSDGYVGDLDYISRATALLETIEQERAEAEVSQENRDERELAVSGAAAAAVLLAWLWAAMKRRGPVKPPTGDDRMASAYKALDTAARSRS